MNEVLKYSLENLEMIVDGDHASGLVPVQKISKSTDLTPEEIIAIENAGKYKVNYVYFQRFENRPSVPQVYIYDFTDKLSVEEVELTDLHKQLYSSGQVPMFFVFTKKDIRIFNCFEPPSEGKELKYKPLAVIELASNLALKLDETNLEKFKAFSGKSFDNGAFWENSKYSTEFKFSNSAYEKLLSELKQALKEIIEKEILPASMARKIMVVSILIKYLEEREDELKNRVFPNGFFRQFVKGATNFTDILNQTGAYLQLLDYLADHFNGGIFQLEDDERDYLREKDLTRFGQFLKGDVEGIQLVLWRLYSFNDLPVELISNIYEEFLGKKPGVVYTPPYLVNFLLDEAMPFTNESTDFKVLDPACGSGVFLVGAFRRLIYRWRKKNNWDNPELSILKKLLKENIFGVELNKEAADLTIFSLSLALCDELTPLQIWEDLKFDDLHEENIMHDDFFNIISKNGFNKKFDLIIGNPPFEDKLTPAAQKIETNKARKRKIFYIQKDDRLKTLPVKLPDNQIALLFLEESVELCKENGLVCLIQPAAPLLYNNSSFDFRKYIIQKYHVPQIIDFTHLSRILFTNGKGLDRTGDVSTAAVFIKNEPPRKNAIIHIIPKRIKPNKEKLYFQLDTYDFFHIPWNVALNEPLIWKSNLFGGGRAFHLVKYLESFGLLKTFLDSKKKVSGWDFGEGFMRGPKDSNKANFLTGQNALLAPNFTSKFIEIKRLDLIWFTSPRRESLYQGPSLLIKELVEAESSEIPIFESAKYLAFDSRIVGISSNNQDVEDLRKLAQSFRDYNRIYAFYIALTSSQFFISLSTAFRADDIYNLPRLFDTEKLELSDQEEIIIDETLKYLLEFRRNGEKSRIATQNATKQDLLNYGKTYCEILQSVFSSIKPYTHFETDSYICYPFYFGNEPNIDFSNSNQAEEHINNLVQKKLGISLRLTRIVRLYDGNVIYLIKPKKLRFWLQSIALRDADETFSDLRKQGY